MIAAPWLIWVLITEGVVFAGTLGVFFGHALWLQWSRARHQPRLTRAWSILTTSMERTTLPGQDRDWLQTLPMWLRLKLCAELASSLSGVQRQRLTELAQEMGLSSQAAARCRSRRWWQRLRGARLFTLVGGGAEAVFPLFRDSHALVRAQAAEWAVDHASPAVIEALLELLRDPHGLCRFMAQNALLHLGSMATAALVRTLYCRVEGQVEAALVVAIGLAEPRLLTPALSLCRDASPRVRALAATLLGALGGSAGVRELIGLLTDPVPEVRVAAVRALGTLGHWPAAGALASLLRDRVWAVRREVALALRAFDAPGLLFLRRALTDEDGFAADMARQVLDLPMASSLRVAL